MNIKQAVDFFLDGNTPDRKIAMCCEVLGLDVADYQHLDNGRKSMTAGNLLRGAVKRDPAVLTKMGIDPADVDLDAIPAPKVASGEPKQRTPKIKAEDDKPVGTYETVPCKAIEILKNGQHIYAMGNGHFIALGGNTK